jgi:hypothetical protein
MDATPDRPNRRSWLALGIVFIGLLAYFALLATVDRTLATGISGLAMAISFVAILPACFGGLYRRDRALFASIAVPVVVGAGAIVVLGWTGGPLMVAAGPVLGWLGLWLAAPWWIEPHWSRIVLRRPPDPEDGFGAAWRAFRRRLDEAAPPDELWSRLITMSTGASERMIPLINTWFCLFDVGVRSDDEARADRLGDRRQELLTRYNTGCREPGQPWPNPDRPTEGTRLELLFPELEALVAAATPEEQQRLADAAARSASRRAGLDPDAVASAVTASGDDGTVESVLDDLAKTIGAVLEDKPVPGLRHCAVASAFWATSEPFEPRDAGEAVYQSARTCNDDQLSDLATTLRAIPDPDRLAAASVVAVDQDALERRRRQLAAECAPNAHLIPTDLPLAATAAIAAVAGLGSVVIRTVAYPLYTDLVQAPFVIGFVIGWVAASVIAWLLLAGFGHRMRTTNTFDLAMITMVVLGLTSSVAGAYEGIIQVAAPGFWDSVFAHRTHALPFAPLYGATFVAGFLVVALVTRRRSAS